MQITWDALIDGAKMYCDDDHDETKGWIAPAQWLRLANVEYALHRRKWVKQGLISAPTTDTAFTGTSTVLSNVLAIVGVAEDLGGGNLRVLQAKQSEWGRNPFVLSLPTGQASRWLASGAGQTITVSVDAAIAGNYIARYIQTAPYATGSTQFVELPDGADERIILGIARRAKVKESSASALLERLIQEADAELTMQAFGRVNGDSPRVRQVVPQSSLSFSIKPLLWFFP